MAPTRTHRDRPRPSGRPQPGSVGRLTKNQMHVHTLYKSSERTSANVPRQSYGYANQSLVCAALPNETSRSPRGSTMLLNIHGCLTAVRPAVAGLANWTRRRISTGRSPGPALSAFRTQGSDLPRSLHGAKKGRENTSRVPHSPSFFVEDDDHYLYRGHTGE